MNVMNVDVAIVGTGTAGMGAYRAAAAHTDSIVLIEGSYYGTTCARVGCMPSKLLIAAAEAAHQAGHTAPFGVHVSGVEVNGVEVMDRVRRERDRFVGFVLESVEGFKEEHKLKGYARFVDSHTLMVDEHTRVKAKSIVLAVGSTPDIPKLFDGLDDRVVINDDVFYWQDLPKSLAVFGPGVIGLELGQALHRLGVRTTIFGRGGRVGPFTDPEIKEYSKKILSEELDLQYCAQVKNLSKEQDGVRIDFLDNQGNQRSESYQYCLVTTGRRPNFDKLCLENAALDLTDSGVPKYDTRTMQCGQTHIFIAGDANNHYQLLHEASDEGRIAGANAALFPKVSKGHRRSPLNIVFCDPQMTVIGSSHADLVEQEVDFVIGKVSFENQGRSRVMLVNKGLMHVYAEAKTGRFLGSEIFGPRAENLGHLLCWSHQQKMTIAQMLDMTFYHPVIEEGLRTALRDANAKLK